EVGYVGRDVEGMVRDLAEQAVNMVKLRYKEELKQKAETIVEDTILDLLIPPIKPSKKEKESASIGYTLNTDGMSDYELNNKTREKFREKLRNGDLEDKKVELEVTQNVSANVGVIGGPMGMDDNAMQGIQDALSGMFPKQKKKRKLPISEARKILLDEEVSKMIDMEEVKMEAIKKAENTGIIFIDEIDKIARNGNAKGSGGDVSREGVQRDLLPVVEGSAVNTKFGVVNTDHILFIAAGAFHFAKPSDLIPELQGRFPIRVELNSLTKQDFISILTIPQNSLTKQYDALYKSEGVDLIVEDSAIEAISEIATQVNAEIENSGARRLHTVMSALLNEFLFSVFSFFYV
ncbi:MAG: ATP-dependent protease ATPase subunit HslU, partial [Bacteroidetes bacterium]